MSTSINLTSSIQQNLYSLQNITTNMSTTGYDLSTGLKVNSALDDPVAYFAAQEASQRSSELSSLKDGMSQAIQTVKSASSGIDSILDLISDAKALAKSALASDDDSTRESYLTQYNSLLTQIDDLADDSGYNGVNLLGGSSETLDVVYDETGSSSSTLTGVDGSSKGLKIDATALTTAINATTSWDTGTTGNNNITTVITALDTAKSTLQADAKNLSTSLSTITTRQNFTTAMINNLNTGSSNLVAADTNEESAKLTTLQTQQQLSVKSLSIANSAAQAILSLFS